MVVGSLPLLRMLPDRPGPPTEQRERQHDGPPATRGLGDEENEQPLDLGGQDAEVLNDTSSLLAFLASHFDSPLAYNSIFFRKHLFDDF